MRVIWKTTAVIGGAISGYFLYRKFEVKKPISKTDVGKKRFLKFASLEYKGDAYMSPLDFIECLIEPNSWGRYKKKVLSDEDLKKFLKNTPNQNDTSPMFFRELQNNGIISYPEYIFLLSLLTQPFRAVSSIFKLLDRDQSGQIDINEYLMIEKAFYKMWQKELKLSTWNQEVNVTGINTTLQVHFFGLTGTKHLTYTNFKRFVRNLQREIHDTDFQFYARGSKKISDVDFVRCLLKYSSSEEEIENYINKFLHKSENILQNTVTFEEFHEFLSFLNNIKEFHRTVNIYSRFYKNAPMSFKKATKMCSKHDVSDHVIDILFRLFDVNGRLNYEEFIDVMTRRQYLGYRKQAQKTPFKRCMKKSMIGRRSIEFSQK